MYYVVITDATLAHFVEFGRVIKRVTRPIFFLDFQGFFSVFIFSFFFFLTLASLDPRDKTVRSR